MQTPVLKQPVYVTLRWGKDPAKTYQFAQEGLKDLSLRWSYVVWKRRRWRDSEKLVGGLCDKAVRDLALFNIGRGDLDKIAEADAVEVGIPYSYRDLCYMPWEFLLTTATSAARAGRNLLVIRRLLDPWIPDPVESQGRGAQNESQRLPLLFVQSLPGRLRHQYLFDTEYKLVRRALQPRADTFTESIRVLDTPTLAKLQAEVANTRPVIVHLSGIDSREGAELLRSPDEHPGWPDPGFYLQSESSEVGPKGAVPKDAASPASGEDLGKACGTVPTLVSVNCFHSATLAADLVSYGARLAIGFQDQVDNPLMELLFANFYRGLLVDGELQLDRVVRNFWAAIEAALREKAMDPGLAGGNLRGTGVVLWARDELVLRRPRDPEGDTGIEKCVNVPPLNEGGARSILECDIQPFPALNYSLLHNDRSLFKRFVIKTETEGTVFDLRVSVNLDVAGARYSYSTMLALRDFYTNLSRIRVSLTSDLMRTLQENVYSSVQVTVQCQGQIVHENTHKVLLLPINEWKDDQFNGAWLPSFVLPYDPAVAQITKVAKKYLQALTDNPLAGFDGYQRVNDKDCDCVHKQVQAIWNTLLHEFRLSYINPPPSFEEQSQRIRTPSQVLAQERGTCIDLALMLAACLEYIDVYPAMFLLSGHAFVGYFTSPEVHQNFGELFQSYFDVPIPWEERGGMPPQPWILEKDARREIVELVREGGLVPIETTFLCNDRGFYDAAQQGRKNLTDRSRFQSVFDVKRARDHQVVPLPIGGENL
jgi:hypothetical protein